MATGYYLSEEKMKLLNELLDERNPRWTKKTTSHSQPRQLFTSPEVFLCQAPDNDSDTNGIDGLTPAGDDDYDHPGSANCTICQIVPSTASDQNYDLVPITDGIRQVFNYSESPIAKSDFFLAVKDKFGNWIAASSKSGLTPRILYDDVAPGDADKNAWPVKVMAGVLVADTDADKVLVQNEFPGTFRGFGTNHTGFTPSPTAKIWTTTGPDGKEHIVAGVGMAKRCTCQLKGAIVATTATVTVDNVVPTDGGQSPVGSSATELTVYSQLNPSFTGGYVGVDNTAAEIEWHENDGRWWIYNMPCDH